jgi:hypothetical protein
MYSILDNNANFLGLRESQPTAEENIIYTSVVYTDNFIEPKFNFETEVFYEGKTLTPEEIKAIAIAEIKAKYEFHRANGWNAYQDFRAMIVLDIAEAVITETQAFLIEKDLKLGYDRIAQNGDWKTAYYELSQVTVSYPFIQPYMDIALSYILDYIANNYDS